MKRQFTQEQVDQGDAFGMTAGEDYELIMSEPSDEDDLGPLDVDRDGLGIPDVEPDGGKPEASASQKDDEEDDDDDTDDTAGEAKADAKDGEGKGESKDAAAADSGEEAGGKEAADADAADQDSEEGEEGAPDTNSAMIPKYRYDQKAAKAERLAAENARLQQELEDARTGRPQPEQQAAKPEPEKPAEPSREQTLLEDKMDDLLVKKNEALIDGDAKAAAKFDKELMQLQRDLNQLTTPKATEQKTLDPDQMREQLRAEIRAEQAMDRALDNIAEEYDVLNEDLDTYDPAVAAKVLRLQRVNMEEGLSPIEALVEAVDLVMAGTPPNSAKNAKPAEAPPKRKTDVKKNIDTARKQPAALADDVGDSSDTAGLQDELPDIDKLTDDEFDKLPKAIQDRMMGNVITH